MNERRICVERESLVSFLYDESDELERRRLERHLDICAGCATELSALQSVQAQLVAWTPPDVPLGFRVTRDPEPRSPWSAWHLPAWLQAAAAVLLVASAAAVANLDVRYGTDGLAVRTGWSNPAPVALTDQASLWRAELAALEERMRRDQHTPQPAAAPMASPMASNAPIPTPAPSLPSGSQAELLRQVRDLLQASERKQQQELALRMTELARDVDVQRRADLTRIEQGLGQIEGEWFDHLVRVSSQGR